MERWAFTAPLHTYNECNSPICVSPPTLNPSLPPSLLEAGVGVNAERLLRTKFSDGEEVFGFVNEVGSSPPCSPLLPLASSPRNPRPHLQVTEKGISVHLSPKALGFIPLMLAHKDPSVTLGR